jgi:hypothetical protein
MTPEALEAGIAELKAVYGGTSIARPAGGATLVRIEQAPLPKGCKPSTTPALLVIQPAGGRPAFYVKPGIRLSNGREPRSTSVVSVEGEAWLQFSYNFPWDENSHSLVQFVAASLQRFAKLE